VRGNQIPLSSPVNKYGTEFMNQYTKQIALDFRKALNLVMAPSKRILPRSGSRQGLEPRLRGGKCCGPVLLALLLLIGPIFSGLTAAATVAKPEECLESLEYQVDAWVIRDAARARIILRRLAPERYRGEITGEARGLVSFLTGQRQDRFSTEMVYRQGRLAPLVYREESTRKGRRYLKEYRFNYEEGRLELWQEKGKELVKKWETNLAEPIYDPLSAFYNCRLGLFGPLKEGETLKLQGIPYPKPEEIVLRIGPMTGEGRKVMVSIINRAFENEHGDVFVFFDDGWTPTQAWTRVLQFGKIVGNLQPGGTPLDPSRLQLPSAALERPSTRARTQVGF